MLDIKGSWCQLLTGKGLFLGGSRITKFSSRVAESFNGKEVVLTILLTSLLVSCAAAPDRRQIIYGPEIFKEAPMALERAYADYWEMRAKKQHANAYSNEVPDFRSAITPEQYSNYLKLFEKAKLAQVEPQGVTCPEERICFVETALTYILNDKVSDVRHIRDSWEKRNGQWFHRIRNPLIFPGLDKCRKKTEVNRK
ncbi:MAG: hypothetical protein AVO38_04170 [delta proteobacterium ML8_D]|jgi:hypothetical protein|nr:MAG: hypothetical protein AVO38_04170 [delta proteobacterium ML8_D]